MRGGEGGDGRTDRARSASLGQNGATERASDQMRQMETPIIESDGWTDADVGTDAADGRTRTEKNAL